MILFFIVGTLFMVLGLFMLLDAYFFRKRARRIRGEVVAYEKHRSKNGYMYNPVVTYEDQGKVYRFTSDIGSSEMDYTLGEEVEVLLLDDQHSVARLKRNDRFFIASIFLFLGSVAVGTGVSEVTDDATQLLAVELSLLLLVAGTYLLLRFSQRYRKRLKEKHSDETYVATVNDVQKETSLVEENSAVKKSAVSKGAHLFSLFLGAALVAGALYWTGTLQEYMQRAVRTTGTIVDSSSSYSDDTLTYAPVVSFVPYRDESIRFTSKRSSSHPSWHVGDEVVVLYDPDDVHDAMIDHGLWNYIVQMVMGLIGLMVMLVSGYQYWKKRRKELRGT